MLAGALLLGATASVRAERFLFDAGSRLRSAPPPLEDPSDLLFESFEDAWLPAGWARIHLGSSYAWERTDLKSHSGLYSAWMRYSPFGQYQDEWLVTPALDLSDLSAASLDFFEAQEYWLSFGEHHYIAASTTSQTDPDAFTMLVDWTPQNHGMPPHLQFTQHPITVSLNGLAGQPRVYLAFRYTGSFADTWLVDDVRVYEPLDHDIRVRQIFPDGDHFEDLDVLAPRVAVRNIGMQPESFTLRLEILESGSPIYSQDQEMQLAVSEADTVAFAELVLAAGHYYRLTATSLLATDMDPSNDAALSLVDTYTQPRVPLGHMHTNTGSGPCAPINGILDEYLAAQQDSAAMIRLHLGTPSADDPMYLANPAQIDSLAAGYIGSGDVVTPWFWVDGDADCGADTSLYLSTLRAYQTNSSPGSLALHWRPERQELVARVDLVEPLDPHWQYRLKLAVTESGIAFDAPNGETVHNAAFRRMFPDTRGIEVSPDPGTSDYVFSAPLDPSWDYSQLRFVAYLQTEERKRVWLAATALPDSIVGAITVAPAVTTVEEGNTFTVGLRISPSQIDVRGCEVGVHFDPTLVRLDSITPGSWFTQLDRSSYWFHDYTPNEPLPINSIHLAAALLDTQQTAPGEIAVCHFAALEAGRTPLTFDLVKVRDRFNTELEFVTSTADSIVVDAPTAVGADGAPPAFALLGNLPNPFNPSTRIAFNLPEAGRWRLEVLDPSGRRLRLLADEPLAAGRHERVWDGRDERGRAAGSGVYLARLSGPAGARSAKMLLIK